MTTRNATRARGKTVVIPEQHVPTIRQASLRLTGIAAENLYRRIDYNATDADLSPVTAKIRLDAYWSLFEALDDLVEPVEDATLPVVHAWAILEAIDYRLEDLREIDPVEPPDDLGLIALGRELEALLAYREQVEPLATSPLEEVTA